MASTEPNLVEVSVYMDPKLLKKLDDHLKRIGEGNRSAWIRSTIRFHLRKEEEYLKADPIQRS